jgi:carbon monoxide dehydrogenase subunit G
VEFEGVVQIKASRQKVWEFLTNPNLVCTCAPALKSVEIIEPDKKFKAVAGVGFGSVQVVFVTEAEWMELNPPDHARMIAHGDAPGSCVDIESTMILSDGEEGFTELKWSADVVVVGTIASLASRLMGGATKKLTGAFFDCVRDKIEA